MIQILPMWQYATVALLSCSVAIPVFAGPTFADEKIAELEGVGITEYLDKQLPLDLTFVDENGYEIALSRYFDGEKPIILTLNYYKCPMLCSLTLNG